MSHFLHFLCCDSMVVRTSVSALVISVGLVLYLGLGLDSLLRCIERFSFVKHCI
jgi:Uri superfamily endonuclease